MAGEFCRVKRMIRGRLAQAPSGCVLLSSSRRIILFTYSQTLNRQNGLGRNTVIFIAGGVCCKVHVAHAGALRVPICWYY